MVRAAVAIVVAVLIAGCGGSSDRGLAQGVAQVKAILVEAGTNPRQAFTLQTTLETGGSIINFIALSLPPGGSTLKDVKLEAGRPTRPWSIVVKQGAGPRDYVIEGYGEKLDRPLHVEQVQIPPVSQR